MKGCPWHGTKHLVKEDGQTYCMAKIKKDQFGLIHCYYHVENKPGKQKTKYCSSCHIRKAYRIGTLCKRCRNEKQKQYYQRKKNGIITN